ncbi:insulin-like growth factor-binding protein 2-B [Aplochiton taeniatus]
MVVYFTCGFLFAYLVLPGLLHGDLVFRCLRCTAERQAACPKLLSQCHEIVREPGCGCCPVCARLEGELCGVYTPRCSTGLRCYPSADAELPLEQLVQGLGRCARRVDLELPVTQDQQAGEVLSMEKRPITDASSWTWPRDFAKKKHEKEVKTKMKTTHPDESRTPQPPQVHSPCEEELSQVLNEISQMSFLENRARLENLYDLKFPNCDKSGNYNIKQCNMSTHGQRGECWCVDPFTGVQISASPRVRGDPNCSQIQEERRDTEQLPTSADLSISWRDRTGQNDGRS